MTSFFANSLVYISHKLDTVSAFLTSSRPFLNSSIVPVIMSKDEIWDGFITAPYAVTKEANLLTLFKESHTLQFTEKLIFKSDEHSELVQQLLQHLVDNTRYFTRTLSKIALPSPRVIGIISGKLTNLKSLDLGFCDTDITVKDLKMISEFPLLEYLDLGSGEFDQVTDEGISHLWKLQSLKKLVLDGLQSGMSLSFLREMKSIKTLDLAGCTEIDDDALGGEGECYLPLSLTEAWFDGGFPDACLQRLKWFSSAPNLESLSCREMSAATIKIISNSLINLKTLALWDCEDKLDTEGFELISENLVCLETLHIRDCTSEITDGIAALSRNCKQLQKLEFCRCAHLDDTCLERLSQISSPLSELWIRVTSKVTNRGFSHLTSLKHLEKLDLFSMQNNQFTGDVREDRTFATTLTSLKMENCNVDDTGLKSLIKGLSLRNFIVSGSQLSLTSSGLVSAFETSKCNGSLESLHINCGGANDLRFLCGLTNLTSCKVYGYTSSHAPPSSDEDIEAGFLALSRMTKLETLFMTSAKIDKYFRHLKTLASTLKSLNIVFGQIDYNVLRDTVSELKSLETIKLAGLSFDDPKAQDVFVEEGLLIFSRKLPCLISISVSTSVLSKIKMVPKLEKELMQVLPDYYP